MSKFIVISLFKILPDKLSGYTRINVHYSP